MNKDIDAQFLCKDCARYSLCEYYHRRKEDSYICKYFHLSKTPKAGHWKLTYRECGTEFYLCNRCNKGRAVIDGDYYKSLDEFKICPNCGAKMAKTTGK